MVTPQLLQRSRCTLSVSQDASTAPLEHHCTPPHAAPGRTLVPWYVMAVFFARILLQRRDLITKHQLALHLIRPAAPWCRGT